MKVVKAIDAIKEEDKRQLFIIILSSREEEGVEIPLYITEDWWGVEPIDHAMDTVVDRRDGVEFYDTCMIQKMEDEFMLSIGFTCASEDAYWPGEPEDFEDEEECEEAMAEFEDSMVYGTLYIGITLQGKYSHSDWETD